MHDHFTPLPVAGTSVQTQAAVALAVTAGRSSRQWLWWHVVLVCLVGGGGGGNGGDGGGGGGGTCGGDASSVGDMGSCGTGGGRGGAQLAVPYCHSHGYSHTGHTPRDLRESMPLSMSHASLYTFFCAGQGHHGHCTDIVGHRTDIVRTL